ncbi:prolyl oligopeptidase family serine peptidase [Thalassobacillus sp. B23F22_16]|uniref:prolyl oligopeptidase family serine peptidase n=1 Tax=Thalassobacillus sp. B23F22_16 TaxID=3459513 RepID=UPI00373E7B44
MKRIIIHYLVNPGRLVDILSGKETSYRTVTEVKDWGAVITKVIIHLGKIIPVNSITRYTFKVHVQRIDKRLTTPLLGEGYRPLTKAYVCNEAGFPAENKDKYICLEMKIGPTEKLGPVLHFDGGANHRIDFHYTITQVEDIKLDTETISELIVDTFAGDIKKGVEDFSTGKFTYHDITLNYADYVPRKSEQKKPLIIWLHGGGEGGTDPTLPLSANKAVSFITNDIQSYFEGAYILVPQAPTRWMDGFTGKADGTSIYQEALMALIKTYISKHPAIDVTRIYVGGASNGGYMTLLMTRDYPGYFAGAFPVCEGLDDSLITDTDLKNMITTPTWFVHASQDPVLPPQCYTLLTYNRMVEAGADNVHLSLYEHVHDKSGLYKHSDGSPFQYHPHCIWIYLFNNDPSMEVNGKTMTIMEWLADQSLNG